MGYECVWCGGGHEVGRLLEVCVVVGKKNRGRVREVCVMGGR